MKKYSWVLLSFLFLGPATLQAYTDQITVKAPEAWAAAKEALKVRGFKKIDEKNLTLETHWIMDRVRRSRGLLKKFASQTYERRYRLTVKVIQRDYDTEIVVRGIFQERPVEINQHLLLWQKYKPEGIDYDLERSTFMQILNRLELARTAH